MFQGSGDLNFTLVRALLLRQTSTTIFSTVFSGNTANNGGAISSKKGKIILIGSTFIANRARKSGGAIYVQGTFLSLDDNIAGNSFTDNSALFDGGTIFCGLCNIKISTSRTDWVEVISQTTFSSAT